MTLTFSDSPVKEDPLVVEDADGLVFAIRADRTFEIGEGVTPEDAARRFVAVLADVLGDRFPQAFGASAPESAA